MTSRQEFEADGFYVAKGIFSSEEVGIFRTHYEELRLCGSFSDAGVADPTSDDPLRRYPRQMQMHRKDELSLEFLCDARIDALITELTGFSPLAVQTMFYFKPPKARGQALHQDNFYLKAAPSTCIAAWMAVDDCDEENGCLMVVPGTHQLPTMCLSKSDTTKSFTSVEVALPEGMVAVPVIMKAGDVLFFNGQVIHGSNPNKSETRFRRSLIAHYVIGDCTSVGQWYKPVYRMDKTIIELETSVGGGQCGDWIDVGGELRIEMFDPSDRDLMVLTE
jgi:ectoine hydroxylase-related dioxygenase (phytanoyl-CoA dioxygenase family)